MNGQLLESRKWTDESERDVLDVLSRSDSPALATDATGHVIFWNHAAELLLGRGGRQVMGRRKSGAIFPMHLSVSAFTAEGKRYFTGIVHELREHIVKARQ